MSGQWGTDEESGFDFLDPNDPTSSAFVGVGGIGEIPALPDGEPVATVHDAAPDTFELDGALSDPTGAVHVWLDDDLRVSNVRVSNRWRERLKGADVGQALLLVLRAAQLRPGLNLPETEPEQPPTWPLDRYRLARLTEEIHEIDERSAALDAHPEAVRPQEIQGTPVSGASHNRMVTVQLGLSGATQSIDAEPSWLKSAKSDDLGRALVEAHADAYTRHVPPTVIPGDYDRVSADYARVHATIMAMLRNGIA